MGEFIAAFSRNRSLARRSTFEQLEARAMLAVLVQYDFTGATGDQSSTAPAVVDPNIAATNVTRGSGITAVAFANSMTSNGWTTSNTLNQNDYYSFGTWTPAAGYSMTLTKLDYSVQSPTTSFKYALRSSLDNFTADVSSGTYPSGSTATSQAFLSAFGSRFVNLASPVEFRLYGFDAGSSTGQLRLLNDSTNSPFGLFIEGTVQQSSTVASRLLFYNQSAYDGNTAGVDPLDDSAISNKVAYLPGDPASTDAATAFVHESNYTRGINGLMVDLTVPGGTHSTITSSDFVFRIGTDDGAGNIVFANAAGAQFPTTVSTRAGAGATGSDRVEMIWDNNSLRNVWLEVQVKADGNTGLAQHANYPTGIGDIFYFANKAGDTADNSGGSYITNSTDLNRIRSNAGNSEPVNNTFDVNKDSIVNSTDGNAARSNAGNMAWFSVAGGGPFAPDAGPLAPSSAPAAAPSAAPASISIGGINIGDIISAAQDTALASGITSLLNGLGSGVPSWLQSRLSNVLDSAPAVKIFHTLEQHDSAVDRAILQTIDNLADKYHLNDGTLDGLLAELNVE